MGGFGDLFPLLLMVAVAITTFFFVAALLLAVLEVPLNRTNSSRGASLFVVGELLSGRHDDYPSVVRLRRVARLLLCEAIAFWMVVLFKIALGA